MRRPFRFSGNAMLVGLLSSVVKTTRQMTRICIQSHLFTTHLTLSSLERTLVLVDSVWIIWLQIHLLIITRFQELWITVWKSWRRVLAQVLMRNIDLFLSVLVLILNDWLPMLHILRTLRKRSVETFAHNIVSSLGIIQHDLFLVGTTLYKHLIDLLHVLVAHRRNILIIGRSYLIHRLLALILAVHGVCMIISFHIGVGLLFFRTDFYVWLGTIRFLDVVPTMVFA